MAHKAVKVVLAAAVATNGTFTIPYPDGLTAAAFSGAPSKHRVYANQSYYSVELGDLTVAFGASSATVTWLDALTIPAGTVVIAELAMAGPAEQAGYRVENPPRLSYAQTSFVNFGPVAAKDDDGACASQLKGAAGDLTLDGALVTGGVAVFDVPRNVELVSATTNHSAVTVTVYGKDEFGATVVESMAGPNAATPVVGVKAFKSVTRVAVSAAIATNGIKVGTGAKLGMPAHIPFKGVVRAALVDDVDELATSTVVAASGVKATATTPDVRGTLLFATAPNGTKILRAVVALPDPAYRGGPQYAG